jgi:transcription initiation factor TFIIIB Brf1 subunit/transcription initiation factor TFIIB
MTDFELFDQALLECEPNEVPGQNCDLIPESCDSIGSSVSSVCTHPDIVFENGVTHCVDCGEEVLRNVAFDKEWRYYGAADNAHASDPNRCQRRKVDDRSIFNDVEGMKFPQEIVMKANEIYGDVTKKKKKSPTDPDEYQIYRGTSRKAIIFACVFSAYKLNGTPETWEDLSTVFGLERKDCSTGIKHISKNAPKKSPIRTTYITPDNLVDNIMDKFGATKEQKKEVRDIYKQIENTSYKLNQSRPKSISAAVIYYWIQKTGKDISIKEFTEEVKLSEITVEKIAKEIDRVLKQKAKTEKKVKKVNDGVVQARTEV